MTMEIKKPEKDKRVFAGYTLCESYVKLIAKKAKEQGMTKSSYLNEILRKVFEGEKR